MSSFTEDRTPWMRDRPFARRRSAQNNTNTVTIRPFPQWASKPRSQYPSRKAVRVLLRSVNVIGLVVLRVWCMSHTLCSIFVDWVSNSLFWAHGISAVRHTMHHGQPHYPCCHSLYWSAVQLKSRPLLNRIVVQNCSLQTKMHLLSIGDGELYSKP